MGSDGEHDMGQPGEQTGERTEGRPSGTAPATPDDTGRPDAVRDDTSGMSTDTDETVAPEEKGEEPETEHAPGSDL
jgi:hypothetical protein